MLVVVSLFFPRKMGASGQDTRLASRAAYIEACRLVAGDLKYHPNALIAVCDQPSPSAFSAHPMRFAAADIVECLAAAADAAPSLPRGGGTLNHETNLAVARSDLCTIIFHAEPQANPPVFVKITKPIIHVGFAGAIDSAGKNPQGFYPPQARQSFSEWLDRYADASTAHFLVHLPAWTEGGADLKVNRFDLGGQGTQKDPGIAWYFDALARRARKPVAEGPKPVEPGKSIFD